MTPFKFMKSDIITIFLKQSGQITPRFNVNSAIMITVTNKNSMLMENGY